MWKHHFVETKCSQRMTCVEEWYKDNAILPPLTINPGVLPRFTDTAQDVVKHSHWTEDKSKVLSLREIAQRILLNALRIGKPENNAMATPDTDWYGKVDLRELAKKYELCKKYSLIIHNIRLCYPVVCLRTRQADDTKWLYCAVQAIRTIISFTSYIHTRVAYTSLLGVSQCKGFERIQDYRFDLVLAFSVEECYTYLEKRAAIRELLIVLEHDRRDGGDDDDLLDAVYNFERFTAVIDRFVGWKGRTIDNVDGIKTMLRPFEHRTALIWYFGADNTNIKNTFEIEVGLIKAYYERFVYYFMLFIERCVDSMCSFYKQQCKCKHIESNVTLLNAEDVLHEIIQSNCAMKWTTGGNLARMVPRKDVVDNHVCSMSCHTFPQKHNDYERLERTDCGHRQGDRMVREHYEFGSVNYSWRHIVCIACQNHIPVYALPSISNDYQGSISKKYLGDPSYDLSSDEEPNRKKSINKSIFRVK